jgi:hypothetical protein
VCLICVSICCTVAGNWSPWSEWICDVTCGVGRQTRSRSCKNPLPQHGGADCLGGHEAASEEAQCQRGGCAGKICVHEFFSVGE